jgi:hypothetical protein
MHEPDEDERREAYEARRARHTCRCGYPDMPGSCPGWQFCPMHGAQEETE